MNVIAKTYASEEHDRPAQEVRGKLVKRYVPTLDYWQYTVDGQMVDPATIREAAKDERANSRTQDLSQNALTEADANKIADALEAHDYDDWYIALLTAAMDKLRDLDKAIALANRLYEQQPTDPTPPDTPMSDEDAKAVENAKAVLGRLSSGG